MQAHELEAWLGDNHGLTSEQTAELAQTADDIDKRYPDPDDKDEREAALTVAYRLMVDDAVIDELAEDLVRARLAENRALAGLRQAALINERNGGTEAGFARRAGVDRMAVRSWLGK